MTVDTSTETVQALIAAFRRGNSTRDIAAATLAALLDERDGMLTAIDEYLPTIIAGLNQIVDPHVPKDELTEQEVSARAALSSAHWLVKSIANHQAGKAIYDLPSVVDLMGLRRQDQQRIRDLEADLAGARSVRDRERGYRERAEAEVARLTAKLDAVKVTLRAPFPGSRIPEGSRIGPHGWVQAGAEALAILADTDEPKGDEQ